MASRNSTSRTAGRPTYAALLRGINVGGKNIIPMAALAQLFEEAGCRDVRTYIQSGNVVFSASPTAAGRIGRVIPDLIHKQFHFRPTIFVRTSDELARVAAGHPLMARGIDTATLHIGFLDGSPDARSISQLDPDRSPGDRFVVKGQEIYLQVSNGMAKTRLTCAFFDSGLNCTSTFRNWRTVQTLAEMMRADG